jgi:uncharacterized protein (TIGR03083 family)
MSDTEAHTGVLEPAAYATALRSAAFRLAAMRPDDLDAPVAACPGWTIRRLIVHVGRIHRWVAVALHSPDGREVPAVARPASGTDLGSWLLEGVDHLVTAFAEAGPDGRVSSPGWERPASWWLRRTTHETTVHAWDAEAAVGAPLAVPTTLALDGIEEVMNVFMPLGLDRSGFVDGRPGRRASLHLHCTDVPLPIQAEGIDPVGEWLVTIDDGAVQIERRHAKGDVAVRASASDLFLLLWNRLDHHRMETHGDTDVLDRYRVAARY